MLPQGLRRKSSRAKKKNEVGVTTKWSTALSFRLWVSPLTSQKSVSYTLQMERTSVLFSPVLLLTSSMRA